MSFRLISDNDQVPVTLVETVAVVLVITCYVLSNRDTEVRPLQDGH